MHFCSSCQGTSNQLASFDQRVKRSHPWREQSFHSIRTSGLRKGNRLKTKGTLASAKKVSPEKGDPTTEYKDGPVAQSAIWTLSYFIAKQLRTHSTDWQKSGYDGLVELTKEVRQGRSADEQRQFIKELLDRILPSFVAASFRTLLPCSKWAAEANAFITTKAFRWLVGDMERRKADVKHGDKIESWQSTVYIKKCRYLEGTGCKAMCVNICKRPTQDFFIDRLGFPVTLHPNFEDMSCELRFGESAPAIQHDPVYDSLCLHAKGIEGHEQCATKLTPSGQGRIK